MTIGSKCCSYVGCMVQSSGVSGLCLYHLALKQEESSLSTKAGGMKFDGGKPQWTLLMRGCSAALQGVVAVLTFGANKYAADSWKQVENGEVRYRDAMYRHLAAIESGELVDPESGLPHWDHIACNAMFLSQKYHEANK